MPLWKKLRKQWQSQLPKLISAPMKPPEPSDSTGNFTDAETPSFAQKTCQKRRDIHELLKICVAEKKAPTGSFGALIQAEIRLRRARAQACTK